MSKPLLVVAISDENYLFPLEIGLAERLYEAVDIEVISDPAYYEEFFTAPRNIDLLIVDERFYNEELKRHNIKKTVLLSEDLDENDTQVLDDQQVIRVFKYLNLKVLMSSIIPGEWEGIKRQSIPTQIIAVISAEGGAGCTTVSLGICAGLKQSLKRTLYVNTNSFQNFHHYLQNKTPMSVQGCTKLRNPTPQVYMEMKGELRQELFGYVPPLSSARFSLGISEKAYRSFILAAQKSGEYDALVVDVGCELTADSISILDIASKVIIVTEQNEYSAFKLQTMLHSISCTDKEKFMFICNKYNANSKNAYTSTDYSQVAKITEYVDYYPEDQIADVRALAKIDGLQKIVYTLM